MIEDRSEIGSQSSQEEEEGLPTSRNLNYLEPRNRSGANQFVDCPTKDDEEVNQLLRMDHELTRNRGLVSKMLRLFDNVSMSERTIGRRWSTMNLDTDRGSTEGLTRAEVIELIGNAMGRDPAKKTGTGGLRHLIKMTKGITLPFRTVAKIMKVLDPEGVVLRDPTARRIERRPLTSAGPNEVWCCDGHDKLVKYGISIWGLRDKYSRKWLGVWCMPETANRRSAVVAYLWLSVVHECGGIPSQTSTDCGSETTFIYGLANTLKEAYAEGEDTNAAHIFLRSVHHIPIERGWLDLRNDFGHSFPHFWEEGESIYDVRIEKHRLLALWLWPRVIQRELDQFRMVANSRRTRRQKDKLLPSGFPANYIYDNPENWGAQDCLIRIPQNVVGQILEGLREEFEGYMDWGVPAAFAEKADEALRHLPNKSLNDITITHAWFAFSALLPRIEWNE